MRYKSKLFIITVFLNSVIVSSTTGSGMSCNTKPTFRYSIVGSHHGLQRIETNESIDSLNVKTLTVPKLVEITLSCEADEQVAILFGGDLPYQVKSSNSSRWIMTNATASWACYQTVIEFSTSEAAFGPYECRSVLNKESFSGLMLYDNDTEAKKVGRSSVSKFPVQLKTDLKVVPGGPNKISVIDTFDRRLQRPIKRFSCSVSNATISAVMCNTPTECSIARNCFQHSKACETMTSQNEIRYEYKAGIIHCGNTSTAVYTRTFFTNLNNSTTFEDELKTGNMDQNALLMKIIVHVPRHNTYECRHISHCEHEELDPESTLYVGDVMNLTLRTSKYVYMRDVTKVQLKLIDGSVIDADEKDLNFFDEMQEQDQSYYTIIARLKLNSSRISGVRFAAMRLNSRIQDSTEYKFTKVLDSVLPYFVSSPKQKKEFKLRMDSDEELTCLAKGFPEPVIEWYYVDRDGDYALLNVQDAEVNNMLENQTSLSIKVKNINLNPNNPRDSTNCTDRVKITCIASNNRGDTIYKDGFTALFVNQHDYPLCSNFTSESSLNVQIIVNLIAGLFFVSLVIGLFVLWRRHRKRKEQQIALPRRLSEIYQKGFIEGSTMGTNADGDDYLQSPRIDGFELIERLWSLIIDAKALQEGNFGKIHKGILKDRTTNQKIPVVVKTPKITCELDFVKFLQEIKLHEHITRRGQHDNIIKYLGAVTDKIQRFEAKIVLEYCELGDLKSYLKRMNPLRHIRNNTTTMNNHEYVTMENLSESRTLPVENTSPNSREDVNNKDLSMMQLCRFCIDIATGMDFLHSPDMNVIHRDLATRNIILKRNVQDPEILTCVISDFGLSKNLYNNDGTYYRMQTPSNIPFRWYAPESLRSGKFTKQSDVWSGGVALWETFSYGNDPYSEHSNIVKDMSLLDFVDWLPDHSLQKPQICTDSMYSIMRSCWNENPEDRPTFNEIKARFEEMLPSIVEIDMAQLFNPLKNDPENESEMVYAELAFADEENFK